MCLLPCLCRIERRHRRIGRAALPPSSSERGVNRLFKKVDSFVVPQFHYDPIKKVFYEYMFIENDLGGQGRKNLRAAIRICEPPVLSSRFVHQIWVPLLSRT
ncbi:hypothetical protein E2562_006971 [Oryza meyeriana var. granulata]|uniref:Uncharacterized protein n=1 Tax=Oryza meyeriana var. granulata TaxID=110450 RepID=A0A6G1EAE5_9ORYZ|nr:hypothetical protein E2562_006971 [Oryza meyeriana var. granulata]